MSFNRKPARWSLKVRPKGGRMLPELRQKGALIVTMPATFILMPLEAEGRRTPEDLAYGAASVALDHPGDAKNEAFVASLARRTASKQPLLVSIRAASTLTMNAAVAALFWSLFGRPQPDDESSPQCKLELGALPMKPKLRPKR
jgi:hypothetical protein